MPEFYSWSPKWSLLGLLASLTQQKVAQGGWVYVGIFKSFSLRLLLSSSILECPAHFGELGDPRP